MTDNKASAICTTHGTFYSGYVRCPKCEAMTDLPEEVEEVFEEIWNSSSLREAGGVVTDGSPQEWAFTKGEIREIFKDGIHYGGSRVDVKGVVERITVLRDELADVRRDTLGNGLAYDRLDEVLRILTESQGERVCVWTIDDENVDTACGDWYNAKPHSPGWNVYCRKCGGRVQEEQT